MSENQNNEEPDLGTKIIIFVVGIIILFAIFGILALLSNGDDTAPYACDTLYNPTACPEPDYDAELEETIREYPD